MVIHGFPTGLLELLLINQVLKLSLGLLVKSNFVCFLLNLHGHRLQPFFPKALS